MLHADVLIVQTGLQWTIKCATTIIGEDTDILVLLCFHWELASFPIYFQSEIKRSSKHISVWNINGIKTDLGPSVCEVLPFVHAILGCDTTSRIFGIGKGTPLKKLKSDPNFKKQAEIFLTDVSMNSIISAGEESIVSLYGGNVGEGLDKLRYRRFLKKLAANISSVQVHTLFSTAAAAQYHSTRVYYQAHEWIGNWMWTLKSGVGCALKEI